MIFNNSPTLRIHKPSQAITNFTVTNAPPSTQWRQIFFYATFLMRFILIVTAICLISLKSQPRQIHPLTSFIPTLFQPTLSRLSAVAGWLNVQGVLSLASFIISISLFSLCEYKEETLTVIKNIGVRLSSANVGWWGRSEVFERPIMLNHLEDMVIHEGFIGSKVKLAIMVRGEDNLVVVFPTLLPERKILELVGRKTKELLQNRILTITEEGDFDDDDYDGYDEDLLLPLER